MCRRARKKKQKPHLVRTWLNHRPTLQSYDQELAHDLSITHNGSLGMWGRESRNRYLMPIKWKLRPGIWLITLKPFLFSQNHYWLKHQNYFVLAHIDNSYYKFFPFAHQRLLGKSPF